MEDYEATVLFQSLQALGCHVDAVCPNKKAGDNCQTAGVLEAMVAFQALQAFGLSVHAVCPGKTVGEFCRTAIHGLSGSHPINYYERIGHKFTLNAAFDEIEWSQYEGLVIPGGRAPEYLAVNASVVNLVRKFSTSGKPMAAICHGSLVLAAADAVRGRKCTAYPGVRHVLKDAGAIWVEPKSLADCVADGNVVTGVTYFGNPEFIRLFVAALGGTISGATNKRILLLCGDHMEDYEVTVPFHTLEALGCLVDAVCPYKKKGETCLTVVHDWEEGSQTYSEKIGQHFTLTADFNSISNSKYDALVIPGGRAPEVLALEGGVVAIVKEFMGANKPVGSIGHGAQILAAAGVLKGRKCTGHPAVKLDIGLAGASWLEPAHVDRSFTDGNLVTAASWSAHPHFLAELMGLLGIHVSFN